MNEELLNKLFEDTGLKQAGVDYEDFKSKISTNADLQRKVFQDVGLEDAGVDYDAYLEQVSGVGMSTQFETTSDKDIIDNATDEEFQQILEQRQAQTDEEAKAGEGSWLRRRKVGAQKAWGNFIVDTEALLIAGGDKLGIDTPGVDRRFAQNTRQLDLLEAEIPSNLKQASFALYVDENYKGQNVEVEVDKEGKFVNAYDDRGFRMDVSERFINDFNSKDNSSKTNRRAKVKSLAQASEQMLYDVGVMLLGTRGAGLAAASGATKTAAKKGLTKAATQQAVKKSVKRQAMGSVAGTAFLQSYGDNYQQALEEYEGDVDKAANVAFEKSAITAGITMLFPAIETGGLIGKAAPKAGTVTQKAIAVGKSIGGEIIEENADQIASNAIDMLNGLDKELITTDEFLTTSVLSAFVSVPGAYFSSRNVTGDNVVNKGVEEALDNKKQAKKLINESDHSEQDKLDRIQFLEDVEEDFQNLKVYKDQRKEVLNDVISRNTLKKALIKETDQGEKEKIQNKINEVEKKITNTLGIDSYPLRKSEIIEQKKKEIFEDKEREKVPPVELTTEGGRKVRSVGAKAYSEAMQSALAKRGDDAVQVDVLTEEEATKIKEDGGLLFMSDDGEFGAYVKSDGYMGGLFKDPDTTEKGVAKQLQDLRIKAGGTHFDAFGVNSETGEGTKLESLYIRNGWVPVSRMKFDAKMAPEGFEDSTLKTRPDVVFFKYDPEAAKEAKPGQGEFVETWDAGIATVQTKRDGSQNTEFFTGKSAEDSSKIPYKPVLKVDNKTPVGKAYSKFTAGGKFTGHISKMIAGFQEKQKQVAEAIAKGPFKKFLDLGTSEGGMIKTVSSANPGIRSVGVDPNTQMRANYESTPDVPNTEFRQEAFLGSWTDPDGTVINEFKTDEKFDVINEDFTFQFINNDRKTQVEAVKGMLTPNGVFVTSEKFHTANQEANEAKKYDHQRKYFNPDQLTEDKQTIVSGMADDMVNDVEYFNILKENFQYVEEFWNAGNFKGYLASDNKAVLDEFKQNVGDLTTEFTDTESLTRPEIQVQQTETPQKVELDKAKEVAEKGRALQNAVNQAISELGVVSDNIQRSIDDNKTLERLDKITSDNARGSAKQFKEFLAERVTLPKVIKERVEAILGKDVGKYIKEARTLSKDHSALQAKSGPVLTEHKARKGAARNVGKIAKEANIGQDAMDKIRSIMGGDVQFRKIATKRASKITDRVRKIFAKSNKPLTVKEAKTIVQDMAEWQSWYDGLSRFVEETFGEYGQDVLALLPMASMANNSQGTVSMAINNAERIYSGQEAKGLGKKYVNNFLKGLGIVTDKGSVSDKMHSFYLALLGDPDSIAVDQHVYSIIQGVDPTKKQKSPANPKQFQQSKDFVSAVAEELNIEPRAVQAALWAANIVRTGGNPGSYEQYFKKQIEQNSLLERIKSWRDQGYKPFYPTVKEIEAERAMEESLKTEDEQLIDAINALDSPNLTMDLNETIKEKGQAKVASVKKKPGLVKVPKVVRDLSFLNGVPAMVTISDTLTTGEVTNPWTGNKIGNLKGGLGFNYSEGNTEHAWAYTDYKTSNNTLNAAKNIYEDNKELFDHLWESGQLPQNQVPVLVVRMGDDAVSSNEAVVRVLEENIESIPQENRDKAYTLLIQEVDRLHSTAQANLAEVIANNETKSKIQTRKVEERNWRKIKEFIDRVDIQSFKDVLENLSDLKIGARPFLIKKISIGQAGNIPKTGIKKSSSKSPVVRALLEGLTDADAEKIHLGVITDLLYEPLMRGVPQRHVMAVNGIDITQEGPVDARTHPNYPFVLKGSGIALIENTNHIADVLPSAYGNVVNKSLGKQKTSDSAISQGIPPAMNNSIFQNVPINTRESAAKELISYLKIAFPNTKFFVGEQAWQDVMNSQDVKQFVKDGDIVYGLTKEGDVYLNPQFDGFNTPIHEVGHIWIDHVQETNQELFQRGAELVEGTKELNQAIRDLGDTVEARKEALAVLIGNRGESLANAAKKSQWSNWLKALWQHVKNTFTSLRGMNSSQISNLTLTQFVDGALADILSGKNQDIDTSPRGFNGVYFSKDAGSNVDTKIRNILETIGDPNAEKDSSKELIKNVFRSVGLQIDDTRIADALKKHTVDQQVAKEDRSQKEQILNKLEENKDLFETADQMYDAYQEQLEERSITYPEIQSIYLGIDPNKSVSEYAQEAQQIMDSAKEAMAQAGLNGSQVESNMAIFGEIAAKWAARNNTTMDQFWVTKIEGFKFVADQNEIPGANVLKQAEWVKKSVWDKIRSTLGFNTAKKYTNPENVPTPLQEDKDLESTPEGREYLEANKELIRGARVITEDGKALIYLTAAANAATPLHEMAHVYEMYMSEDDKQKFLRNIGQGSWDTRASEMFARGFEQFLKEGRTTSNDKLQPIFDRFKGWLRSIYDGLIRYEGKPIILNKEMNEVFANMFNSELTNLDKYKQESTKFVKAIEQEELQMKSDTFRKMSDMFGLDLKNTYQRGTLASRARQAISMGYTTRQFAIDESINLLKVVAETGPNSVALDPIKAFGMKFAVAEMQQQAFDLQQRLESNQREGIENAELAQDYIKLVADINNINTVLTLTSSTAAALLGANAHKFKTDWFDSASIIKTIETQKGSSLDEKQKAEIKQLTEEVKKAREQIEQFENEQRIQREQERIERVNKGVQALRNNPVFKQVFEDLANDPRPLGEIRKELDAKLRAYYGKTSFSTDSAFDDTPLQEYIAVLIAMDPDITTVQELTQEINITHPAVTQEEVLDLLDTELAARRAQKLTRTLLSNKNKIEREANLVGQLKDILSKNLEPQTPLQGVNEQSDQVVLLQNIIKELKLLAVDDTGDYNFFLLDHYLDQIDQMYGGLTAGTFGITEISAAVKENMLDLLQQYEQARSKTTEEKIQTFEEKIRSIDSMISHLNTLFNDSKGARTKEERRSALQAYRGILRRLAAIPETEEHIDNMKYNKLKAEYARKKSILNQKATEATQTKWAMYVREVLNTPRNLILSFDYSYINYQMGFYTMREIFSPRAFRQLRYITDALKSSVSDAFFTKSQSKMLQDFGGAYYDAIDRGLIVPTRAFSESNEPLPEETLRTKSILERWLPAETSRYAKLNFIRGIRNFNERGYVDYMSRMRVGEYIRLTKGVTDPKVKEEIAERINTFTGATTRLSKDPTTNRQRNKVVDAAADVLIAPRLYISVFKSLFKLTNIPDLIEYSKAQKGSDLRAFHARAIKDNMHILGAQALGFVILSNLARMLSPGEDDEPVQMNPMLSGFMKTKVGQTMLTLNPYSSYIRSGSRIGAKIYSELIGDDEILPSKRMKENTVLGVTYDEFFKYRMNPVVTSSRLIFTNKDWRTREVPTDLQSQLVYRWLSSVAPISITGVARNAVEGQYAQILPELALDMFGFNSFSVEPIRSEEVEQLFEEKKFTYRMNYPKDMTRAEKDLYKQRVDKEFGEDLRNRIATGKRPNKKKLSSIQKSIENRVKKEFE